MAQSVDVRKFCRIVWSVSKRTRLKNTPAQDLEQQLWLKLCQVMPKYSESSEDELFSIAKTVLLNHAVDLLIHDQRANIITLVDLSFHDKKTLDEVLSEQLYALHDSLCSDNPERKMMVKEIFRLLLNWGSSRSDPRIYTFITTILDPDSPDNAPFVVGRNLGFTKRETFKIFSEIKALLVREDYFCPKRKQLLFA